MKTIFDEIADKIDEILNSNKLDGNYIMLTEDCYQNNKDKLVEINSSEPDLKIYTIPANVSISKLVEEYRKK